MNRIFGLFMLASTWLIASCQPINMVKPTPTTALQTAKPQITNTAMATFRPMPTATPTAATVVKILNSEAVIEIPEWVKDPKNSILLLSYGDGDVVPNRFGFVNPQNGDQISYVLKNEYYFLYWKDATHVVFLHGVYCDVEPQNVSELDVTTGVLIYYQASAYPDPILRDCYHSYSVENDLRINWKNTEPTIEVADISTGLYVPLTDPNDGISDIAYTISPDKNYVSVVQYKGLYEFEELYGPIYGNRMSVYSLKNRNFLTAIDDGENDADIFQEGLFIDDEHFIFIQGKTLCHFSILTASTECFTDMTQKLSGATLVLHERSRNIPQQFSFVYFGGNTLQGGYCFFDLISEELNCPTDRIKSLRGQAITSYSLSDNQKYLLFTYDSKGCPTLWCDNFDIINQAVLNLETNQLFEFGIIGDFRMLFIPILDELWRPSD